MLAYMERNRTSIAQAKPESRKHFKQSEENLHFLLADIFLTTANMDMKIV